MKEIKANCKNSKELEITPPYTSHFLNTSVFLPVDVVVAVVERAKAGSYGAEVHNTMIAAVCST